MPVSLADHTAYMIRVLEHPNCTATSHLHTAKMTTHQKMLTLKLDLYKGYAPTILVEKPPTL